MDALEVYDAIQKSDHKLVHPNFAQFTEQIMDSRDWEQREKFYRVTARDIKTPHNRYETEGRPELLDAMKVFLSENLASSNGKPSIHLVHPFGQVLSKEYWEQQLDYKAISDEFMEKVNKILTDETIREKYAIALHAFPEDFFSSGAFLVESGLIDQVYITETYRGTTLVKPELDSNDDMYFAGGEVGCCLDTAILEAKAEDVDTSQLYLIKDMLLFGPKAKDTFIRKHYTEKQYRPSETIILPANLITFDEFTSSSAL